MKLTALTSLFLILALFGCNKTPSSIKFDRVEDAAKAMENENLKIDALLNILQQKNLSADEKKDIICTQIPEHYDQIERIMDTNR